MHYLVLPFRTDEDKRLFEKSTFEDLEKLGNFECIPIPYISHYIDFIKHFNLQKLPLRISYEYFEDCYVCVGSIEECADFLIYLELVSTSDTNKVISIIQNNANFFYNKSSKVLYISPDFYNNILLR